MITSSCKCQTRNKLFEVFHIWPFAKCLNKIQLWYRRLKKVKVPYSTKFVELKWHHSRLNYILWLTILPYMKTFWWTVSGSCVHKILLCYTMYKIVKVPYLLFRSFGLLALKRLLNYLAFKSFHYECTKCTWWRLLQKRVVCTKLDSVKPVLCDLPRKQWNMVT